MNQYLFPPFPDYIWELEGVGNIEIAHDDMPLPRL